MRMRGNCKNQRGPIPNGKKRGRENITKEVKLFKEIEINTNRERERGERKRA